MVSRTLFLSFDLQFVLFRQSLGFYSLLSPWEGKLSALTGTGQTVVRGQHGILAVAALSVSLRPPSGASP